MSTKTKKSSRKTTKTATTKKSTRATRPRQASNASARNFSLLDYAREQPLELVKDIAGKSLRLSLGLGSYLFQKPENIKLSALRGNLRENLNTLVTSAINKGEKIEQRQLTWLSNFEREQRKRVASFLEARRRDIKRTEANLEARIEDVIAGLDIPTRQDIHQLNRRLNDLSKELARQRANSRKTTGKKSKSETVTAAATNA